MKQNRIDVQILRRKAEWVLYSANTPEQIVAAQTYFKLYENVIERWHGKAFSKMYSTAVIIGFVLVFILLCASVKFVDWILR